MLWLILKNKVDNPVLAIDLFFFCLSWCQSVMAVEKWCHSRLHWYMRIRIRIKKNFIVLLQRAVEIMLKVCSPIGMCFLFTLRLGTLQNWQSFYLLTYFLDNQLFYGLFTALRVMVCRSNSDSYICFLLLYRSQAASTSHAVNAVFVTKGNISRLQIFKNDTSTMSLQIQMIQN